MPETVALLKDVYELLSMPENWCQGALATDIDGYDVAPCDPYACRWDIAGAVYYVGWTYDRHVRKLALESIERVTRQGYDTDIQTFNDSPNTTHDDVVEVLGEAIADAENLIEPDAESCFWR